jgi:mannose-6-phosphate isomerase-like protein (cupin superfamily)
VGGQGKIRIDDHTHTLTCGDIVVICPGQRHKVWPQGEDDLVLLVTCAPAYSMDEVIFTEQTP